MRASETVRRSRLQDNISTGRVVLTNDVDAIARHHREGGTVRGHHRTPAKSSMLRAASQGVFREVEWGGHAKRT